MFSRFLCKHGFYVAVIDLILYTEREFILEILYAPAKTTTVSHEAQYRRTFDKPEIDAQL